MSLNAVALTPIIPIVFAFALPMLSIVFKGNRKVVEGYALVGTGLTLLTSVLLFLKVYSSSAPLVYSFGGWRAPVGIIYEVDRLGALMAIVTTFLMFLITIYSYRYIEEGLEWYYTLYLGLEAGLLGVFLTGDAFNLFVMIEVTSIAAYALVMFYRNRWRALSAGLRYAFIGAVGTTIYFIALAIIYYAFGTLNMANMSALLHGMTFQVVGSPYASLVKASAVALALAVWAFLIKAAIVPNHFWLPDAHPAAPTPVSAVLSGLVVNAGVYAVMRFIFTIYRGTVPGVIHALSVVLMVVGAASALLGAILMVVQRDVKRLIAYSTIMHMGYIVMAIGVGSQLALEAAIFHTVNHAIAKALLFLSVGIFIRMAGSRDIARLSGLGRKASVAMIPLAISALSLVGIPPFNVFFSKLLLFDALSQRSYVLALVLVVSSVIALTSYMRVLYEVWLGEGGEGSENGRKAGASMTAVCVFLAIICIALGIAAPYVVAHYIHPAASQAVNYTAYVKAALSSVLKV